MLSQWESHSQTDGWNCDHFLQNYIVEYFYCLSVENVNQAVLQAFHEEPEQAANCFVAFLVCLWFLLSCLFKHKKLNSSLKLDRLLLHILLRPNPLSCDSPTGVTTLMVTCDHTPTINWNSRVKLCSSIILTWFWDGGSEQLASTGVLSAARKFSSG